MAEENTNTDNNPASITTDTSGTKDTSNLPDIELNQDTTNQTTDTTDQTADQTSDTQTGEQSDPDKVLEKTLEDAGFDVNLLIKEVQENEGVTPELVSRLKEKIDPDVIDSHLARIKAEAQAQSQEAQIKAEQEQKNVQEMNTYIYDQVGGEEKFTAMAEVLKDNIPAEKLKAINELLASGSKEQVNIAMKAAVDQYNTIKGKGNLMQGDTNTSTPGIQPMGRDEYRTATSSDKYKTDPDYAKQVDSRRLATIKKEKQTTLPGQYFKRMNGKVVRTN